MNWTKKEISSETVKQIAKNYGTDLITSSILTRRGITEGKDILYFLEDDKRFLHSPFLFKNMEDAVDRILQAVEEEENVLIFGDRDVDGVTSTTLLYEAFTALGLKTSWQVPQGEDPYGLNIRTIDEFNKNYGTLIVTVDCGISNIEEIKYAQSLGMDVIVLDHHEPGPVLPEGAVIIDPKCADSGYPFDGISGCAVAFKLISALRFARSELYKNEICLLNAKKNSENGNFIIEAIKVENLVEIARFREEIDSNGISFYSSKLSDFLSGQQIFVWNGKEQTSILREIFGNAVQFNFFDLQSVCENVLKSISQYPLEKLKSLSKIAKYYPEKMTEIDGFYNIFVTLTEKSLRLQYKNWEEDEERDLQLVMLAAFADIMPLTNENRIFCRHGLASLNSGKERSGLKELMSKQNMILKRINSTDISWGIVPVLNAAGRLGKADLAVKLFIEPDPAKREELCDQIIVLNNCRKTLGNEGWAFAVESVEEKINEFSGKLCIINDKRINKGITGILASRLSEKFNIPAIVMTENDDGTIVAGSMRSGGKINCPEFLRQFEQFFLNFGGHDEAAGFSLESKKCELYLKALKEASSSLVFVEKEKESLIDAELPPQYLKSDLLNLIDRFEPYGNKNSELTFVSKNLPILDGITMGKTEKQHLKLTLDCGETKWPALFWGEGERLHRDFDKGDSVNILYRIQRNTFNGVETPQMIIQDIMLSK